MKKLITVAVIFIMVLTAAQTVSCNSNADKKISASEDSIQQVIARGKYLATNVAGCMDCHSDHDFQKFSGPIIPGTEGRGGFVFDQKLGLPGVIYAKNITPDQETGIGNWTDEELMRAITQGISKNGDTLFPIMPYPHYNHMAKEDLLSIIAYVRSLKPIKNQVPQRELMIPIAMAYPADYLQPSIEGNSKPPESDQVNYGKYLANMADCGTCHSPLTPQGPDMSRMFAGGYEFDLGTFKVVSPNITPDPETGIGTWTEAAFVEKFKNNSHPSNVNRDPGAENTIMPWSLLGQMKESDLKAIFAYLKTVTPISNKVEKYPKKG